MFPYSFTVQFVLFNNFLTVSFGKVSKKLTLFSSVILMRKEFEKNKGVIKHISGDINPADLGFHK